MACRSARQVGEKDYPGFMAAMQLYKGHQPGYSEACKMVGLMFHVETDRETEWFWKGGGGDGSSSWLVSKPCADVLNLPKDPRLSPYSSRTNIQVRPRTHTRSGSLTIAPLT